MNMSDYEISSILDLLENADKNDTKIRIYEQNQQRSFIKDLNGKSVTISATARGI